jgi:hypothetical protein
MVVQICLVFNLIGNFKDIEVGAERAKASFMEDSEHYNIGEEFENRHL